jgi:hypothetical protein
MDEKPKRLLDNLEFASAYLALIWFPAWIIVALHAPRPITQFGAAVFGVFSIWIVVRGIGRRLDARSGKRPPDPP